MAKLSPRHLAQVLSKLPTQPDDPNVLVGYDLADDAGVYKLTDEIALVQTVDFFTPIADDPAIYGRIAALNSLNDVYAMGATPLTALSIVCYPGKEDLSVLAEILQGGQAAMNEASVVILGGHSVDDQEIKIGYAVTGVVHPDNAVTNANAKPGDAIILTKPIGTGAISTGLKNGIASASAVEASIRVMSTSAAHASAEMQKVGVHACTDITGFGLLGHAYEVARASNVTLMLDSSRVPLLPEVLELIKKGMLTRGDKYNREYVGAEVIIETCISRELECALYDPQTAGGLLISVGSSKAEQLARDIPGSVIIGEVQPRSTHLIRVQ